MQVNVHGGLHRAIGIPNQDACRQIKNEEGTKKVSIVCDGCTNIDANNPKTFVKTHSEVGAGLFCSLYETLEDPFDVEKFPENANIILEKMLSLINFDKDSLEKNPKVLEYIVHNYFFTILACFETEDAFTVYILGDGFIFVRNNFDVITYIERKNGNNPPYIVNNYLSDNKVTFQKFIFSKEEVKNVGIASDGIAGLIRKENVNSVQMTEFEKLEFDKLLTKDTISFGYDPEVEIRNIISRKPDLFADDTTIVW